MINEGHCFFAAVVHSPKWGSEIIFGQNESIAVMCLQSSFQSTVERVLTTISEYLTHFMVD